MTPEEFEKEKRALLERTPPEKRAWAERFTGPRLHWVLWPDGASIVRAESAVRAPEVADCGYSTVSVWTLPEDFTIDARLIGRTLTGEDLATAGEAVLAAVPTAIVDIDDPRLREP